MYNYLCFHTRCVIAMQCNCNVFAMCLPNRPTPIETPFNNNEFNNNCVAIADATQLPHSCQTDRLLSRHLLTTMCLTELPASQPDRPTPIETPFNNNVFDNNCVAIAVATQLPNRPIPIDTLFNNNVFNSAQHAHNNV